MRYILLILLFPYTVWAQELVVKGWVKDQNNQPIPNIEVTVLGLDDTVLASLVTDSIGVILYTTLNSSLRLSIDDYQYEVFDKQYSAQEMQQPIQIILQEQPIKLDEVLVNNRQPLVKRKVDRLVFNVENTTLSSMNAWEIIRNTPLVSVSMDAISIKGNQNIVVTMNGKKTLLTGDQLKSLLENTDGSEIKSVEVITNPPANYEAAGGAVLNIVMKKNAIEGYRGSASIRQHQSQYARNALGLTQFYKKGKLSTMLAYTYSNGTFVRKSTDVVRYVEDGTTWESRLVRKNTLKNRHQYNFVSEYELDSLTMFTFGVDGFFSPNTAGVYTVPTIIFNRSGERESFYLTTNNRSMWLNSINGYAQFDKKLSNGHQVLWTNYFTHQQSKEDQSVLTQLDFINQPEQESQFFSNNGQRINLFSTDFMYSIHRDKWKWDSGGKMSWVNAHQQLRFSDDEMGDIQFRPEKSNTFQYNETISAVFTTFDYTLGAWNFKAGLRGENTAIKSEIQPETKQHKSSYFEWFPTLYAMYETPSQHQFTASYGKRISRPSYSWLNPAKSYYNLFSYFQGDPYLKATISHDFEIGYTYKNWILGVFYSQRKDPSMEISYQVPETKTMVYHYTNIEKSEYLGASLNKEFKITPWATLNTSLYTHYGKEFFFGVDNQLYKNDVWEYQLRFSTDFQLNKDKDWKMQLGYRYNSPSIQGSFNISANSNVFLVMNKKFFDKKLDLSLVVNDIFRSQGMTLSTKYANQDSYFTDYSDTQSAVLTIKYNFGNSQISNKKSVEKTEEQNRI